MDPVENVLRFDGQVRIPVSGTVKLSPSIRRIIDTRDFQRLRGIKQLGPTCFVYPGATHTRFEHSVGTYGLSIRYLQALTRLDVFVRDFPEIERVINLVVLSALLHDVGHSPFSHWIEEIHGLPEGIEAQHHEAKARNVLENGPIGALIEKDWHLKPKDVANVIDRKGTSSMERLANSVIDHVLDVDKADYLVRDSVHCGVPYGQGIDVDHPLNALYYDKENASICLNHKGRAYLLSLLGARNIMYQEIYWHKTVRACTAMFKKFFYHLATHKGSQTQMTKYLQLPDDQFVLRLHDHAMESDSLKKYAALITPFVYGGRELYKPAYIFNRSDPSGQGQGRYPVYNFFEWVLDDHREYSDVIAAGRHLAHELGCKKADNIIIEQTPQKKAEKYVIETLHLYNLRNKTFEANWIPDGLRQSNEFLSNNRQAYVFCHPSEYDRLKRLDMAKWKAAIGAVFETMIKKTGERVR